MTDLARARVKHVCRKLWISRSDDLARARVKHVCRKLWISRGACAVADFFDASPDADLTGWLPEIVAKMSGPDAWKHITDELVKVGYSGTRLRSARREIWEIRRIDVVLRKRVRWNEG